jgi:hypothetical protein
LKPLPATAMVLAQFKPARVNIDYHVAFEGHYYSVPHQHVGAAVELRITATTLEVLLRRQRIAAHAAAPRSGRLHHGGRAHAGVAPGAPAVDAGQAHRLG